MQGISVFLLFPLLESIHAIPAQAHPDKLQHGLNILFEFLKLEKSLIPILILFVSLIGLRNYVLRWQSMLSAQVVLHCIERLRKQLYHAIIASSWLHFRRHRPAYFNQALTSDIERIGQGVMDINRIITQTLLLLSYAFTSLLINWQISLCVALAGLVAVFFQQRMAQRAYGLGFQHTEHNKKLYQWIKETLDNFKLIQSSGNEKRACDFFAQTLAGNRQSYLQSNRHHANLNFYFQFCSALILAGFIYISITWLQLPAPALLVLIFVFSRMMPLVNTLWMHFNHLQHMRPAYEHYDHLYRQCLQQPSFTVAQATQRLPLKQAIRLQDICFSYPFGRQKVLKSINLTIPAHKITVLTGASGAGKTTLCDLIAGLYKPVSGKIAIDGVDLTEQHFQSWRQQIIYLTQLPLLFNTTLRNNLRWYKTDASDKQLLHAIDTAELSEWFAQLEHGLDTLIGAQGVYLSGGEEQRLVLARAFLSRPGVLILDEASSALDIHNEQKIIRVLTKLKQHTTLIMITHRLDTMQHADYLVILDRGQVIIEQDMQQTTSRQNSNFIQQLKRCLDASDL